MRRSTTWYQKPVGIPSTSPASSMNRPMLWNTWGVRMVTKYPRRPIPVSAASRKRISCMRQRVLSPSHPDVLRSFRRRSPEDSAVGSSAPLGSRSAPPVVVCRAGLTGGAQRNHDLVAEDVRGVNDIGGQVEPVAGLEDYFFVVDQNPHPPADHPANLGVGVGMVAVDVPRHHVEPVGLQAFLFQAGADLVDSDLPGAGRPVGHGDFLHGIS